jgi:hypothetical protein
MSKANETALCSEAWIFRFFKTLKRKAGGVGLLILLFLSLNAIRRKGLAYVKGES